MKKIVLVLLFSCLFFVNGFAEVILTPTIGLSHIGSGYGTLFSERTESQTGLLRGHTEWVPMTVGFSFGILSRAGFTFVFTNDISFLGTMKFKTVGINQSETSSSQLPLSVSISGKMKGFFWESALLFGYTFRPIQVLHISIASGIAAGGGTSILSNVKTAIESFEQKSMMYNFGIPLHIGVQGYFTRHIGIHIGAVNVFSIGGITSLPHSKEKYRIAAESYFNNFTLKIGPTFKI